METLTLEEDQGIVLVHRQPALLAAGEVDLGQASRAQ